MATVFHMSLARKPHAPLPPPARAAVADANAPYGDDESRLAAVRARDARADGQFFYSVKTTGVYCRPSCAARPARRENLAFHDTCADAEAAGFRACKRCRPDEASQAQRRAALVAAACRAIDAADTAGKSGPDLAALAEGAGMSRFHFHRVFKEV
ncbi:MAG TPA: Ada metal-binding domain-containing protein, partial [Burkholderiales bacterium]|nr:Ada metal-binding domain-containing protein [Burkholderiales bacterium]